MEARLTVPCQGLSRIDNVSPREGLSELTMLGLSELTMLAPARV